MLKFKLAMAGILSLISLSAYAVPPNAHATANGWACNTGFKRQAQQCNKIFIPPNAVLKGQGWTCKRGYIRVGQQCNKGPKTSNQNYFDELLTQLKTNKQDNQRAVKAAVKVYRQGNFKQAYNMLYPLAKKNEPRAQFYLGIMHAKGEGVLKDYKAAAKWMGASAKRNYPFT